MDLRVSYKDFILVFFGDPGCNNLIERSFRSHTKFNMVMVVAAVARALVVLVARTMAPPVKSMAFATIVRRRPYRSTAAPPTTEATKAPTGRKATTTSMWEQLSAMSLCIGAFAPDITPVLGYIVLY